MAIITIDQKPFEVDQKKNLLENAISLGLEVPYFCWHPALGSVGSCRLCAVQQYSDENDTVGRTVMACMTPCKDQSRFSIEHPTAKEFRQAVVEWIMTNHPHDCPVCDEGGECHLQDMTLLTGHNYRDYRFQKRTHNNQNLGPFINHEMNRCISCYRCVRYYKDVAGGTDLAAFKSSGKVYFGRFDEGTLESEFSGNLVEICPTGVFTDKPYHQNYVRKWDLSTSPSVCQLCSVGCNISLGERTGTLRRVQNRYHNDINGFFICDRGRFGHDFVNSDRRIFKYTLKQDDSHVEVPHDIAMAKFKELLSERVVGFGSPSASLEANFALKSLVGSDNFYDVTPLNEKECIDEAVSVLKENGSHIASLKDIREADAVLIIGEDITNTAPILALAIRQAAQGFKQKKASEINIDYWNDAAVKDYVREDSLPIFSINAFDQVLDGQKLQVHPFEIADVVLAINQTLLGQTSTSFETKFITDVAHVLSSAKKPVIIAGTSLNSVQSIKQAQSLLSTLTDKGINARLSLVLPDVNTVGLNMLKPKSISKDVKDAVAIVLEQDLQWRIGQKAFSNLPFKRFIAIDSFKNDYLSAELVIPTLSFLESSGSLVSSEGRLQRFYGAAPANDLKSSFHVLAEFLAKKYQTIDDVAPDLAKDLGIDEQDFKKIFDAEFRIFGQKIPRQTNEASGRTALKANINVHEQKPPSDPDSPLAFSMEGARKKIPLPLISSSWAPKWNSVQASFKTILGPESKIPDAFGGVRLFNKNVKKPLSPVVKNELAISPNFYILPKHNIFSSFQKAQYSTSMSKRKPELVAEISQADAKNLGILGFASVVVEVDSGKFSFLAKINQNIAAGVLLLPYGLVDASLFFKTGLCRVVNKEQV